MAKKRGRSGVNQSQAIRGYLAEHPEATPKEIVAGLAQQGVKVSEGLAGNVKYTSRSGRGPGKARRGRGRPPGRRAGAGALTAQDLIEAKRLADQLGGLEQARKALEALEALR